MAKLTLSRLECPLLTAYADLSALVDDVAKTNAAAIMDQYGITTCGVSNTE